LAHLLPTAGLRIPTTFTVLPQTLTGTCTGACTVLPDSTPGESELEPMAPESACATPPAAAITPVAAAMVIKLLRVTCRITEFPPAFNPD
jgi:hypothetical protein